MEILVAKSYQGLPIVEEPYVKSGKTYCKVKMKSGSAKEVRVYSQKEYDKMYPAPPAKWKPQREMLGFGEDGYVIIFNGAGPHEEFFEKNNIQKPSQDISNYSIDSFTKDKFSFEEKGE